MILRSLAVAAFLLFPILSHADYGLAYAWYKEGKLREAFDEYYLLATTGDHDAQYNLGAMYLYGDHVPADITSAYAWIALSAQKGGENKSRAKTAVFAELNEDQKLLAQAKEKEILGQYGDEALERLMTPHFTDIATSYQPPKAINKVKPQYPGQALHTGIVGFTELSYHVDKDGVPHDIGVVATGSEIFVQPAIEALRRWRFDPARIDEKPIVAYGENLRIRFSIKGSEKETEQQMNKTLTKLRKKAESGSAADLYQLAYVSDVLSNSENISINRKEVGQTLLKSANLGFSPAQFQLGKRMLVGNACSANPEGARSWLQRAALSGLADAQYLLAMEMISGAIISKNESGAMLWLTRAADSSYASAQLKLAWILATHPDSAKRNGRHAQNYLQKVSDTYYDHSLYYEAAAAVHAELGDFKQATEWQQKALDDAKEFELPLAPVQARMNAYQENRSWTEAI